MSSLLAAAPFGANLILGLFIVVAMVGLVFGYYTITGSGINNHPSDGRGGAPGAKLPDEFHQFAARQIHDADLREAEIERRVEARLARKEERAPQPSLPGRLHLPRANRPADDMSLDEVNRKLAAEASARKASKVQQEEHAETHQT